MEHKRCDPPNILQVQNIKSATHRTLVLEYSILRREFFQKLASSKFCICPRGNAYDTFRMWDAMYVGTIPIVVREAHFHQHLLDLPILFLDSYHEYGQLTKRFIEREYQRMLPERFNYAKLCYQHWIGDAE